MQICANISGALMLAGRLDYCTRDAPINNNSTMGLATLWLVILLCAFAAGDQVEISLNGDSWILSDTTGRVNKIPATVPGQVHLDLR